MIITLVAITKICILCYFEIVFCKVLGEKEIFSKKILNWARDKALMHNCLDLKNPIPKNIDGSKGSLYYSDQLTVSDALSSQFSEKELFDPIYLRFLRFIIHYKLFIYLIIRFLETVQLKCVSELTFPVRLSRTGGL